MHPTTSLQRWWIGVVMLSIALGTPVSGQQPAPPPRPSPEIKRDRTGAIIVPLNRSIKLQMKSGGLIRDVFNEADNIVTVAPDASDPRGVIILGRSVGLSRVTLTDVDGNQETYQVVVQPDLELLRNLLRQATPTANVEVIPGPGNTVVLTGTVAHAEDIQPILQLANNVIGDGGNAGAGGNVVNAMRVGGVQQVQLDVVVAQVSRTKARNRGFSFGVIGETFAIQSIIGGTASNMAAGGVGGGGMFGFGGLTPGSSNINFGIVPPNFGGFLEALKTEGLAKLLAEPKLVTQSGRPARLLSGGRQAVLSAASGINGPGVTFEDIGTELEFLPIVYGNGKIYLEVAPRVRSVNAGLGIVTTFGTVPGFDEQSLRTAVVMESGQTFALGGLIQTATQASTSKVPVIGELPFVGPLFNSISITESEQELVILVTVHLVDPMDCAQVPKKMLGLETRSPSDFEVFLETTMEAPRGQRTIFENKRYKAPYKNSPTYQQYPCNAEGGACVDGNCAPGEAFTHDLSSNPNAPIMLEPNTLQPLQPAPAESYPLGQSQLPGGVGTELSPSAPLPGPSVPGNTMPELPPANPAPRGDMPGTSYDGGTGRISMNGQPIRRLPTTMETTTPTSFEVPRLPDLPSVVPMQPPK